MKTKTYQSPELYSALVEIEHIIATSVPQNAGNMYETIPNDNETPDFVVNDDWSND